MARELAAVEKVGEAEAIKMIEAQLAKGPRRGAAKADELVDEAEESDESEVEAA